jgi:hypothetical protein
MTYYGDEALPALGDEQWARLQAYQATVLAMRLRSLEEADQHVGAPGLALACKEARTMALAATPVKVEAGAAWRGGVWGTVSRAVRRVGAASVAGTRARPARAFGWPCRGAVTWHGSRGCLGATGVARADRGDAADRLDQRAGCRAAPARADECERGAHQPVGR